MRNRLTKSHRWVQRGRPLLIAPTLSAVTCIAFSVSGVDDVVNTNSVAIAHSQAIGGSPSVASQLSHDDKPQASVVKLSPLDDYEQWLLKQRASLRNQTGLTLAGDYNALVQGATESLGEDWAAGGVFRVYGNWSWPGEPWKNPGSLTFKVESRHRYTDVAPQQLGGQIGYSSLTGITWSDAGWLLSNFYWHQQFLENRLALVAGIVDVTDYVDTYGLVNPWTDFVNSTFGTSPTLAAPGQGLGAAVRGSLTPNLYVLAGFANANGDPTQPGDDFDTFFNDGEFFKHIELGWITSWEQRQQDNIHMTFWQTAERSDAGVPNGWGMAVSASHLFADRWLPFVRAGWSDGGGGVPLETAVAVGVGYYLREKSDLLALGFNWGRPSSDTYGSGLRDEYTLEMLYRLHLLKRFSVTPDVQVLIHPALNPNSDVVAVFGLRARLVF